MIIDFHTHIFDPSFEDQREEYIRLDPLFAQLYSNAKAKLASAEDLITSMDQHGITASVVLNIAWNSPDLCRESNQYILESISRYPGRLFGFVMVDFSSPETAIEELDRCMAKGVKGVGEVRLTATQLRNPQGIQPVLDYIIKKDLVLMLHTSEPVGHNYPGKGDSTPDLVYSFVSRFPDLKLVCAHWGGGLLFYALMPEVKKALGKVYFDSAASSYLYTPGIYSEAAALAGEGKILFGSDYPLLGQDRLLKEIKGAKLPDSIRNRFLYSNAASLLGLAE